jgi:hypothetical protein
VSLLPRLNSFVSWFILLHLLLLLLLLHLLLVSITTFVVVVVVATAALQLDLALHTLATAASNQMQHLHKTIGRQKKKTTKTI